MVLKNQKLKLINAIKNNKKPANNIVFNGEILAAFF